MNLLPAIAGGVLIGAAVVLMYAGLGRIAGISGTLFNAIWDDDNGRRRRVTFLGGLIVGAWLAAGFGVLVADPGTPTARIIAVTAVAGLLTGLGTRLGGGCTSGHGICGNARLSPRSLVATLAFMGAGMATATLLRPLLVG